MNRGSLQRLLKLFFSFISLFGLPLFYVPVAAYLLSVNSALAIRLVIILVMIEVICAIIKLVYHKERPTPLPRKTLFQKYEAGGFPSIHSARILAVVIAVTALYHNRLLTLAGVLLAMSVGYSRIYLKKHDWIDIIGGFLIGTLISLPLVVK